jgi:hypothetical protein
MNIYKLQSGDIIYHIYDHIFYVVQGETILDTYITIRKLHTQEVKHQYKSMYGFWFLHVSNLFGKYHNLYSELFYGVEI